MGNCLKTQLKENVQNNNLDILGCLKLKVHTSGEYVGSQKIAVQFSGNVTHMATLVDCTTDGGQTSMELGYQTRQNIVVTGENPYILIPYKYDIVFMNAVGADLNINDLDYSQLPNITIYGRVLGNISKFTTNTGSQNYQYPSDILLYDASAITGDVSGFGSNGRYIRSISISNRSNIIGSLDNLGYTAKTLNTVNTRSNNNKVTIDVVEFVKKARKVGETSKDTAITFRDIAIYAGGQFIEINNLSLTWTPTTITYNGTTIQNSEIEP